MRKRTKGRGWTRLPDGRVQIRFTVTEPDTGRKHDVREIIDDRPIRDIENYRRDRRRDFLAQLSTPKSAEPESAPSLGDYADTWMARMRPRWKASTRAAYADLVAIIKVDLGEIPLDRITRATLFAWRDQQAALVGPVTVNGRLRALRAILSEAADEEIIGVPNFRKLYLPEPKRDRVLRPAEVEAFLAAVRETEPTWYPFTLLAADTAARKGEIIALTWNDVDLEAATVTFSKNYYRGELQDSTKTGEDRTVPLTDRCVAMLKSEQKRLGAIGGALVFPSPRAGGYLSNGITTRPYRRAAKVADLRDKDGKLRVPSPHWFRHSLNDAVRRAKGEVIARAILGHKQTSMTGRYSSPPIDEMRAAIAAAYPPPESGSEVASKEKAADVAASTASENPSDY